MNEYKINYQPSNQVQYEQNNIMGTYERNEDSGEPQILNNVPTLRLMP